MDVKATQKADFADRLKAAIDRKGWSMSETARQASSFLNEGEKFGRAHVWHYVQGRALPRFRYLEALSLALNLRPDDLMPAEPESGRNRTRLVNPGRPPSPAPSSAPSPASSPASSPAATAKGIRVSNVEKVPQAPQAQGSGMVHVRDYGDGTALLEISERVPWPTALTVLQILKKTPG